MKNAEKIYSQFNVTKDLINQLLACAVTKCQSYEDAEDLVQEVLLSYISAIQSGKIIEKPESWLYSVLNRKYYDILRKKYKRPAIVTFPENYDIAEDYSLENTVIDDDITQILRQEIAYLSGIYREIVVRHYFCGETLETISKSMNIPLGTIKSRLFSAKKQLKKGIEIMENYTENSYAPKTMYLRNSGYCGLNDEPMSVVPDDDILSQNLLMLAYEKPVTVPELSRAIGIPTAYIEPVIKRLVEAELMCITADGGKVYTDFIIYEENEENKYIGEAEEFVEKNNGVCIPRLKEALYDLRKTEFWSERLERYMTIGIYEAASYRATAAHLAPQVFPKRPNGGEWIAFGMKYSKDVKADTAAAGKHRYSLSGERNIEINDYLGYKRAVMYNYETSLYQYGKYDGFEYSSIYQLESDVLRLICAVKTNNLKNISYNMLKYLPLMEKNGMTAYIDGKPEVLVPCLTKEQFFTFKQIQNSAANDITELLKEPIRTFISDKRKKIPAHLANSKSISEIKLYSACDPHPMMYVYNAVEKGIIPADLGYLCPETIVMLD